MPDVKIVHNGARMCYSYLSTLTGFRLAAFKLITETVSTMTLATKSPAAPNDHQLIPAL